MRLLIVLVLLAAVIAAQETKWAPVPRDNTTALWVSMALAIIAYLALRSGWGRPETHRAEQQALGTTSNSYYEPRRAWISNTFAIVGGITGAMWWGATSWLILVRGMERALVAHGLMDLEVSVVVGVLSGGIVGAAVGLLIGELWERRHRLNRAKRVVREN